MRIIPLETTSRTGYEFRYWDLKFKNSEIEASFQAITSKNLSQNPKIITTISQLFLIFLIILYVIAYLLELSKHSVDKSMILRLTLLLSIFAVVIISLSLPYSRRKAFKFSLFAVSYTATGVFLILNDDDFQNHAFDKDSSLNLSSLPGLITLTLLYTDFSVMKFHLLLLSNVFLCTLYAIFSLLDQNNYSSSVLKIILLLLSQMYQLFNVYLSALQERKRFIEANVAPNAETEKMISENCQLDTRILDCVDDLFVMLPSLNETAKSAVEKTISLLKHLNREQKARRISDTNIEAITKGLDEEDKLFIEQTWSNTRVLNVRKREKAKVRVVEIKLAEKNFELDMLLLLKQIGVNWNLNTFDINTKSKNQPISVVGKFIIKIYNLLDLLSIEERKLDNFLHALESNYKPNPYHNAIHAVDILCSGLYIANNTFLAQSLSELESLSSIIAYLAHDIGHPGFSNRFLINFQDKLALQCNIYIDNDISVLENMHASLTFSLLTAPNNSFLESLESDNFLAIRKLIIELILATDMGKHFELLSGFKAKDYSKADIESANCKLDALKVVIKSADIGHAAKTTDFHMKWSLLICEEFFRQGDIEKESGRPASMYCDRETTIIPKSQIGFLRNIALPLYEILAGFFGSTSIDINCLEQLKNNIISWEFEILTGKQQTLKDSQISQLLSDMQGSLSLHAAKSGSDAILSKS